MELSNRQYRLLLCRFWLSGSQHVSIPEHELSSTAYHSNTGRRSCGFSRFDAQKSLQFIHDHMFSQVGSFPLGGIHATFGQVRHVLVFSSGHPPLLCLDYAMSAWFGLSQIHSQFGSYPQWLRRGARHPSLHISSTSVAASRICRVLMLNADAE